MRKISDSILTEFCLALEFGQELVTVDEQLLRLSKVTEGAFIWPLSNS